VQGRRVGSWIGALSAILLAASLWACNPLASKGTIPPADRNGNINIEDAPDFISVVGPDGTVVGYARKELVLGDPGTEPWPVYAANLVTLVGHMVPGHGFVPLGVDPKAVPTQPVQQGPSTNP